MIDKLLHCKWTYIALAIIICISALAIYGLKHIIPGGASNTGFKITGEYSSNMEVDYASVVYMDGFVYSTSGWLGYSRYISNDVNYEEIKGEKLGEVTLDLKGKKYSGIPPSFASTMDIGTEIFSIKNIKKEQAVLVISGNFKSIFYRERKAVDEKTPFNLKLSDVFSMMSNLPEISAVELRDEMDGSWMRTSEKESLISLASKELPGLEILNMNELGQDPYTNDSRIPVNLIFKDGSALHMQVFTKEKCARVFGGYIRLSDEICKEFEELSKEGNQYPSISDLLPYDENSVEYLFLSNKTNGDEILCKTPQWSRSGLYSILHFYRVKEAAGEAGKQLVMTAVLGKSKADNITVNFYETEEKQIITEIKGTFYQPVKGRMLSNELFDYLYNNTDLGLDK